MEKYRPKIGTKTAKKGVKNQYTNSYILVKVDRIDMVFSLYTKNHFFPIVRNTLSKLTSLAKLYMKINTREYTLMGLVN